MTKVKVIEDLKNFNFPVLSSKKNIIDQLEICLSRISEDIFFAFLDRCPHDRASLSTGKVTANELIECPWHHYRFQVFTGRYLNHTCANLTSFDITINKNELFIHIPNSHHD